jgi:hypothetical protein
MWEGWVVVTRSGYGVSSPSPIDVWGARSTGEASSSRSSKRAPVAGRVVGDVQLAVVGVGQPPGDVQPEAQPTGSRSGVPGTPRVPFEDALACIGWDARALVLDGQHRLGAVAASDQPDQRSWRAVGGGVVEQVA